MDLFEQPGQNSFSYLEKLNPAQRDAVEALDGPVLVLAGAGTGKTRVLTTRLGHLLNTGRAKPWEILAVTFTNKAAAEMKHRVAAMLGQPVDGMWLGTFHSIAARMLRQHAELVGLKSNFTILDDDDQIRLLKQVMEDRNVDAKKWPPRMVMGFLQRWKDRGETPTQVNAADGGDVAGGKLPEIYREYQSRLRTLNACDFGDLLMHILTIFRDPAQADVIEGYQRRFRYILVDEYQDTNFGQYLWLRLLAQGHKNICCVGDDDQSIYGWRGAEIGNILRFEKDFPGAKIVRLEQNYRSTGHILSAANGVIAYNKGRLGKELWSAAGDGEKIAVTGVWDGMQEAQHAAATIDKLKREGFPYSQIAVLVRASHQTRAFEERFMREGIPHKVLAGMRFYERQEIRDIIAYLRAIAQADDDLALERIINLPKRGIGLASVQKMQVAARNLGVSMHTALERMLADNAFTGKTGETLRGFMASLARWRGLMRELSHVELAQVVLDESGYAAMWQASKEPEAAGRLEGLREFVGGLSEFESLPEFLEHVSLVMDTDTVINGEQVTIMTYHGAKGLEFDAVILPGWEEGLFPNQRALDENGLAGLEEERRLAYVGITRARKRAFIFFAANRFTYGSMVSSLPSRFIDELPKEHTVRGAEMGVYGGQQQQQQRSYSAPRASLQDVDLDDDLESTGGFSVGDRVSHETFGLGTVIATDHDKLDIKFDKAGRKKIVDRFVTNAD